MEIIKRYNTDYYHIRDVDEYIDDCTKKMIAIISLEFFEIYDDDSIKPYTNLFYIDRTYDKKKSLAENVKILNAEIKKDVHRFLKKDSLDLYFCPWTIDKDNLYKYPRIKK